MTLSNDLISQFAKITNDEKATEEVDTTLYGTIVEYNEDLCVKLDGSDEITPISTTSTVKSGERVTVTIKNHSATVMGNLSDPSASSDELHGIATTSEEIALQVGQISLRIDELGVKINGMLTIESLENGTTVIDGGWIKTGTIDAQYLNLTGAITFGDLASDVTTEINTALSAANTAISRADTAKANASTALTRANEAVSIAEDITIPNYIRRTYIDSARIKSPEIYGNNISVYGTFQTWGYDENDDEIVTGYMGAAKGLDAAGNDTYGVALSYSWNSDTDEISDNYVIVTDGGVRLQAGDNRVVVTEDTITLKAYRGKNIYIDTAGTGKAYYNNQEIATV